MPESAGEELLLLFLLGQLGVVVNVLDVIVVLEHVQQLLDVLEDVGVGDGDGVLGDLVHFRRQEGSLYYIVSAFWMPPLPIHPGGYGSQGCSSVPAVS